MSSRCGRSITRPLSQPNWYILGSDDHAARIAHDALLGAAVLAVGLDETDVLVLDTLPAGGLHGPQKHRLLLSPHDRRIHPRESRNIYGKSVTTDLASTHRLSRQFAHLHVVS